MKKSIITLILLLGLPCISWGATGVLQGHCERANPNADDVFLVGLGNDGTGHGCFHGVDGFTDTIGAPAPYAANLNKLFVVGAYDDSGTSPQTFSVLVEVYINGTASGLSCSLTLSGGTPTPAKVACNDSTTVLTVAAGDVVSVKISSPGIHAAQGSTTSVGLAVDVTLNLNKL